MSARRGPRLLLWSGLLAALLLLGVAFGFVVLPAIAPRWAATAGWTTGQIAIALGRLGAEDRELHPAIWRHWRGLVGDDADAAGWLLAGLSADDPRPTLRLLAWREWLVVGYDERPAVDLPGPTVLTRLQGLCQHHHPDIALLARQALLVDNEGLISRSLHATVRLLDEPHRGESPAALGLQLLAFLGAGYDHRSPNRHQRTVTTLVQRIRALFTSGLLVPRQAGHSLCAMALGEAYAMTNDPLLREPLSYQIPDGHWADTTWSRADVLLLMSEKARQAGGMDVGGSLDAALAAWHRDHDRWRSGGFPRLDSDLALRARFALAGVFLGIRNPVASDLSAPLPAATADWMETDPQSIWFATLACFQCGGATWQTLMASMSDRYVPLVQLEHLGEHPGLLTHDLAADGVAAHAMLTLSLEVFYRYLPMVPSGSPTP